MTTKGRGNLLKIRVLYSALRLNTGYNWNADVYWS